MNSSTYALIHRGQRSRNLGRVFAAVLALCGVSPVFAIPVDVFSQGPSNNGIGFSSSPSPANEQSADNFRLNASETITGVRWWGVQSVAGPLPDLFDLSFFDDASGVPAALPFETLLGLAASRTATALTEAGGLPVFEFNVALPVPLPLLALTDYYLSIFYPNETPDANQDIPDFFWLTSDSQGSNYFRTLPLLDPADPTETGDDWFQDSINNLAFALQAERDQTVPEPGTALLLSLGLVGMSACKRGRRAAA